MSPTAAWVPSNNPAEGTDSTLDKRNLNGMANRNEDICAMKLCNGHSKALSSHIQTDLENEYTIPEQLGQMPIAIIGMACRLSGDVSTPDEFWEFCSRTRSGWSEIPKERFNNASFHHPNPGKSGCHNPVSGHFLKDDLGLFDAQFFNITAQEAVSLDPQQRISLECTFEALEMVAFPSTRSLAKISGCSLGALSPIMT